mmetsp:Transcript_327/g.701  ORF Transcript_327/g.701 Transcript_327/m.701 type:complete len:88 (+) Transcript_327:1746-2009(+)
MPFGEKLVEAVTLLSTTAGWEERVLRAVAAVSGSEKLLWQRAFSSLLSSAGEVAFGLERRRGQGLEEGEEEEAEEEAAAAEKDEDEE